MKYFQMETGVDFSDHIRMEWNPVDKHLLWRICVIGVIGRAQINSIQGTIQKSYQSTDPVNSVQIGEHIREKRKG